jgi:hypothetical protein
MKKHQMLRLGMGAVMPALLGFVFVAASALAAPSPTVIGDWQGSLTTGGGTLRIIVHVSSDKDGKLTATMDSPDQGVNGIEVTSITFKDPDLHFEIQNIGGSFDGKINKDNSAITGTWMQGPASLPLILTRSGK